MQHELIDVMQDQVRLIYRAVTGTDIPEPTAGQEPSGDPVEQVTIRFAELETLARSDPFVAELVPPFSFTPPLDAAYGPDEVVVELAIPGVDRGDVNVEIVDGRLIISGLRRSRVGDNGHRFCHAEIPRGTFYRALSVPLPIQPEPEVTLERGMLRIGLKRAPAPSAHQEGS